MGGVLRADTPSPTPSFSPSPTQTASPTPGPGSYSYTVFNAQQTALATPFVVPGNRGNSLQIDYTLDTTFAPGSTLAFDFPADVCGPGGDLPTTYTFYAGPEFQPQLTYTVNGSSANGYSVTVTTASNLTINAGTSLIFTYGQDSGGGFAVPGGTTQTSESFLVWANPQPQSASPGPGGLVPAPSPILVYSPTASPTATPTFTISPTFTITTTSTISPTFTVSPTATASPTDTPVGPIRASLGFYTYPNPFDLRLYPFVTVRFPPTSETVSITIFSLVGNPVCEISQGNIQAAMGVAQWNGTDDYGRIVPGGLYFVRLKTPSSTVVHKMTVFH